MNYGFFVSNEPYKCRPEAVAKRVDDIHAAKVFSPPMMKVLIALVLLSFVALVSPVAADEKNWSLSEIFQRFLYALVVSDELERLPDEWTLLYTVKIGQTTSCSTFNRISVYSGPGNCRDFDWKSVRYIREPHYSNNRQRDYYATALFVKLDMVDLLKSHHKFVRSENRCFYSLASDATTCPKSDATFNWNRHRCECLKSWVHWRKEGSGEDDDGNFPHPPWNGGDDDDDFTDWDNEKCDDDDDSADVIIDITPFDLWPLCTL